MSSKTVQDFFFFVVAVLVKEKSCVSKCLHQIQFYRREIVCLIYQFSSLLCKTHILNKKAFYSYIFALQKWKNLALTKFLLPFALSSPHFVKKGHFVKVLFSTQDLFFSKERKKGPDSGKQKSLWAVKIANPCREQGALAFILP